MIFEYYHVEGIFFSLFLNFFFSFLRKRYTDDTEMLTALTVSLLAKKGYHSITIFSHYLIIVESLWLTKLIDSSVFNFLFVQESILKTVLKHMQNSTIKEIADMVLRYRRSWLRYMRTKSLISKQGR